MLNMNIGSAIKKYRKEKGLSMEQFAKLCGRSKGYISMLEKGANPRTGKGITPSIDTVTQIASAMQVSLDKLLSATDDIQKTIYQKNINNEAGYVAEEILAYYDAGSFIPIKPISLCKNQAVVVTLIDESTMSRADIARHTVKQLKGILSNSEMSSEAFVKQKQIEKELER